MSWPILLAEYPKALLESKLPLIILILLERSGLTTEQELGAQVRVKHQALSSSLLDLHRNQCIVFGRNSVRISERGKTLLDRFQLRDGILEELLDVLSPGEEDRAAYRSVIMRYRDTAFSQYLNSVCTIRTWQTIANQSPWKADQEEAAETSGTNLVSPQAIMFTILLRDLRNWMVHTNPPRSLFENLSEDIQSALASDDPDFTKETHQSVKLKKAVRLLKMMRSKDESWPFTTDKEAFFVRSLTILDNFQQRWDKDDWYEAWCDVSPSILEKYGGMNVFLKSLESKLPSEDPSNVFVSFRLSTDLGSGGWWVGENKNDLTDFFSKMMLANSTEDLAKAAGMSQGAVNVLVSSIKEKAISLLESRREVAHTKASKKKKKKRSENKS